MLRRTVGVFPNIGRRFASTFVNSGANVNLNISIMNQFKALKNTTLPIVSIVNPLSNRHIMEQDRLGYSKVIEELNRSESMVDIDEATEYSMTSVLRKRRLKMKKHKLRKRRKAERAKKIRLGK